jgi:threonyl-tRNA synthetase
VDNGFYYEMALPDGAAVHAHDWAPLESIVSKIVKEKQPFQRLVRSGGTAASRGSVLLLPRTI